MNKTENIVENIKNHLKECEYLLIGLGNEWEQTQRLGTETVQRVDRADVQAAYEALARLTEGKNYFIVTTAKDAAIFDYNFDSKRITAPCGNITWMQCRDACTKDIWELGEVVDGRCPHCGAELVPNTIACENYIEEGYLPQWKAYQKWLAGTLNKNLLILELGVGFQTPTVIRWPFEKTAFFNQKAHMYRVNKTFYQISEELKGRAVPVEADSLEFVCKLAANR